MFTNAESDNSVPFYLQPTLGGASHLRGFRESRFRDQNSVLVGAEYRWEAWWALDAALFVDAGMVAPSRDACPCATRKSATASDSASTATAPSSRASTWRSVARVSCRS